MDNTTSEFHKVLKPKTPFLELNTTNMELLNNFSEMNQPLSSQIHGLLDYLSNKTFIDNNINNPNTFVSQQPYYVNELHEFSHQSLLCSLDQMSHHGEKSFPSDLGSENHDIIGQSQGGFVMDKDHGIGVRKRKRKNAGKEEKPREVIHVRAKRGQATDSHSLAERVRRERINEKLRALQDIVPGCYKTMGMAVMLDVIINYVRSLQNQIEFLSMKLSAASLYYNFNSPEAEALETLHKTTNPGDVLEVEKIHREESGGIPSWIQSTWPPGV